MIRLSIAFFYKAGAAVRPLRDLQAGKLDFQTWSNMFDGQTSLAALLGAPWFWPAIRSSYNSGQTLLRAIEAVTNKSIDDEIVLGEVYSIRSALSEFETVLNAELSIADTYFATRKAGYDTSALISNAEVIFSADLGTKVPQAIPDIREAGKCLAFELGTASGLHVMRALEAVLRRYWEVVSGGKPHPSQKNMGAYLKKMDDNDLGSKKIRATLRQIKDLHRNPLSHPQESLTLPAAIGLFGIAQSAVSAMIDEIPAPSVPVTPAIPSSS